MSDKTQKLPDISKWQPTEKATETLQSVFLNRCIGTEKLIQMKSNLEKELNINNFDSGPGVEDIIREELRRICPSRYFVTAGVINDRDGKSGGDFDLIIFNELWFPQVKAGATEESRRAHFPIEGIYAVGEVKQTLDIDSLDTAMKKLVSCKRLNRPLTFAKRLVENRESSSCSHGLSNPLYSFIIATDIKDGVDFNDLADRFYFINKSLKRLEVIRALCVVGKGTLIWGYRDSESQEIKPALFMLDDLYFPLIPIMSTVPKSGSALYSLVTNLLLHLYHSVLAPEDIAVGYGSSKHNIQIPTTEEIVLEPDEEWLDKLQHECDGSHYLP